MAKARGTERGGRQRTKPGQKLQIVFRLPQAPKAERAPKGKGISIPVPLMDFDPSVPSRDRLSMSEHYFLQYLIQETYGEHRLELESTLPELIARAKALYERRPDPSWQRMCRREFTKPRIERALKKFQRRGFIEVCSSVP